MSTTNLKPCRTNNTYKFITVFKDYNKIYIRPCCIVQRNFTNLSRCQTIYFIMILLSIYIYNWIGNKFLQLTSPSPYKYSNSINKSNDSKCAGYINN